MTTRHQPPFVDPIKITFATNIMDLRQVDGTKFYLDDGDRGPMVRPSGLETVLCVYAQGAGLTENRPVLDAGRAERGI